MINLSSLFHSFPRSSVGMQIASLQRRVKLLSLITFYLFSLPTLANDWLQSAELNYRPRYIETQTPLTDPQAQLLDYSHHQAEFYALIKLHKSLDKLNIISQLRPSWTYQQQAHEAGFNIDELYLDYALSPSIFLSLGKRNLFTGVALGRNPTDYLAENKSVDSSQDPERRRDLRRGNYLLTAEWYLDNAHLSLAFAPQFNDTQPEKNRLLLRYNQLLEAWNTDVTGFVFLAEREGLGLNLSTTVNDNWVVYADVSLRRGRDRQLEGVTTHHHKNVFTDAVLGSNYSFNNGLGWYAEYWYQENGYSDSEWQSLIDLSQQSTAQLNSPAHGLGIEQLVSINQALKPLYLRQHYLFNRLSYAIDSNTETSLSHIFNLDDNSQLIRWHVQRNIADMQLRLQLEHLAGQQQSAFAMRTAQTTVLLNLNWRFSP